MQALGAKEGRQLAERNGGKNGTKKYQGAQPDAERKVNQRVKECSHKLETITYYTGGLPVSRSIRRAIGGWVEKRLAKLAPPQKGSNNKQVRRRWRGLHGKRLE